MVADVRYPLALAGFHRVVEDSATVPDVHNLADLVRCSAAGRGDRPALRSADRVLTWADLDARVDSVAAGLVAAGDRAPVVIALPNVAEFATAYFGVLRAGLVAVPVNPAYTARELGQVLTDAGAGTLISTAAVRATLGDAVPEHTYLLEQGLPAGAGQVEPTTGGEDVAVLLYTSGTGGAPKAAMLSHRALLANHQQLAELEPKPVTPDDVVLLALPLFHAYGLNTGLGAVAYHGACGVLVEHFDAAASLETILARGVTTVVGVPPMFVAWSALDEQLPRAWSGVRTAVCGAAPLDAATAGRFARATGTKVHQGYGLTETAPVLTSTLAGTTAKPGSIGRAIPGVELRLVDPSGETVHVDDDHDEQAGSPGTDPGEIVVRGRNLFSGYWPDGADGPREDGWWATGDVAYADEDGDLFLVDRIGELILVSGFNVYPAEIEQVLNAHPGVQESAAIGVPNEQTGQSVKVFVVRARGVDLTVEDLMAYAERNLARFKCPAAIEFVESLPHSATGKVRKAALR
jgi:long-chain acyl-CoA synthetase